MMGAGQWVSFPLTTYRRADGACKGTPVLSRRDKHVLATDGMRLHAIVSSLTFPEVPAEMSKALAIYFDDDNYSEDIEADLWEPQLPGYRIHLFEDVVLDEKFYEEAISGLGLGYTCAVWDDRSRRGPVRFRSADKTRVAYVMPVNPAPKENADV